MTIFYHGAPKLHETLKPQRSAMLGRDVLFVTPNRLVAAVFSVRWDDSQMHFSIDYDGRLVLQEMYAGEFDRLFTSDAETFLYCFHLSRDEFHSDPALGLQDVEFVTERSPRVLFTERIVARHVLLASDHVDVLLVDGSLHQLSRTREQ
jgi:hypothetical protein